jgi:hypothetical protein
MPSLPVEFMCAGLDDRDAKLIRAAFNGRNGCLRASKPYRKIDFNGPEDRALFEASANYVWRTLCFDYCGFHPYNCLPVTADCDLGAVYYGRAGYEDYDVRRDARKSVLDALDALIKRAESALPITAQKGVMQWCRALGMLG